MEITIMLEAVDSSKEIMLLFKCYKCAIHSFNYILQDVLTRMFTKTIPPFVLMLLKFDFSALKIIVVSCNPSLFWILFFGFDFGLKKDQNVILF